ncbi:hypothetical protein C1H76_2938 [Elsinoe australis]|uniref:Uncharacterized protein n=1 Tax=Elsinoe australis TaxID=40998 RepID=A0A4U7B116_9PEZI|nr:hypothetical protein C1H76_2938 [Elsinoe australis]
MYKPVIPFAVFFLSFFASVHAQLPIESYQRWLMIIKPNVNAGGEYVGQLNQSEIDSATEAFLSTWPDTISDLTFGRVHFETRVIVSPRPLTNISTEFAGMITPEHLPLDVSRHVSPSLWDGVAIYAGFDEHAMWGTSSAADVGWFSVSHSTNLSSGSYAMAAWTHEMLHTMSWYFGDERLGPVAPVCKESKEGRDGTHCGEAIGYKMGEDGLGDLLAYYRDYLNGEVRRMGGRKGLGSQAWRLGTRREAYLGIKPGSLMPAGLRKREVWDEGEERAVTPWGEELVERVVQD